ncbi:hypothetical protein [Blattabacterium cuenoti]|uniref:hypothetical protein n=1 Tax=Blattabacterium cuenoti TaxID=1653831 RepID=UPI00163C09F3|nr:hypothetical protein [Blattabacterium cuenoti]
MKIVNFFIILSLFMFSSFIFSHNHNTDKKCFVKIGTHDINYFPINYPFKNFFDKKQNSFDPVISNIEIGHNLNKYIVLYTNASSGMIKNNKWELEDVFFFKSVSGINLHVIPNHKIDPYLKFGAGIHNFNNYKETKLKISDTKYFQTNKKNFFVIDGGIGLNLWLVPNFGVSIESTYNHVFARQSKDYLNFWKHNIGFIFSFGSNNKYISKKNTKTKKSGNNILSIIHRKMKNIHHHNYS